MASITLLANLTKPGGLWSIIINGINNGVFNFGWTIVLFTIIVRLALSPLDFLMRWSSKKTTLAQKKLQPQIDKINKKYSNDKRQASIQTQALYKREKVHMGGTCLFSLLYLVLTLVVFTTLFTGLRKFSAYRVLNQYNVMEAKYDEVLIGTGDKEKAGKEAADVWKQNKDGWLWIENIWRSDAQGNPVPTYSALKKIVSNGKYKSATERMNEIDEAKYNEVTAQVRQDYNKHWNGYYVLAVLSIGLTFLSQWIIELGNGVKKKKDKVKTNRYYGAQDDKQKKQNASKSAMGVLKYVMPVIMAIFVMTSSASFGIYIVVSSAISTLTSLLINFCVKRVTRKQEEEVIAILEKQEKKKAK